MIFLKRINNSYLNKYRKLSYSQSGEDLLVRYIFDAIGVSQPSYLDIGAHHPFYLSNTALFYENGSKGINVEPDPELFKKFLRYRSKDTNLNIGIGIARGELDFYIISSSTLNTFSKEEAERYELEGDYKITAIKKTQVDTVDNIINKYFNKYFPDFLNIDAEGVDEIILHSINYTHNYPTVICVETLSFSTSGRGVKNTSIIDFITSNNYLVYADTNINTIFVRKDVWIR